MQKDEHEASAAEVSKSARERSDRITTQIRACVEIWDKDAFVRTGIRPDGKLDITVISSRFDGLDSRAREAEFWLVLGPVPQFEMVFLTYGLLLTPQEAEREFGDTPILAAVAENWDE